MEKICFHLNELFTTSTNMSYNDWTDLQQVIDNHVNLEKGKIITNEFEYNFKNLSLKKINKETEEAEAEWSLGKKKISVEYRFSADSVGDVTNINDTYEYVIYKAEENKLLEIGYETDLEYSKKNIGAYPQMITNMTGDYKAIKELVKGMSLSEKFEPILLYYLILPILPVRSQLRYLLQRRKEFKLCYFKKIPKLPEIKLQYNTETYSDGEEDDESDYN